MASGGVQIIREWTAKMNLDADESCALEEESGINIVRAFMNKEREEFGWPGSTVPKLSKRRSRNTNTPSKKFDLRDTASKRCSSDEEEWRATRDPLPTQSTPAKPQASPCKFFFSSTGCRFGNECRFSHEMNAQEEEELYEAAPVPLCPYFMSGFCRFGDQCCYAHVVPEELSQQYHYCEEQPNDQFDDQEVWEENELDDSSQPGFSSSNSNTEDASSEDDSASRA